MYVIPSPYNNTFEYHDVFIKHLVDIWYMSTEDTQDEGKITAIASKYGTLQELFVFNVGFLQLFQR